MHRKPTGNNNLFSNTKKVFHFHPVQLKSETHTNTQRHKTATRRRQKKITISECANAEKEIEKS